MFNYTLDPEQIKAIPGPLRTEVTELAHHFHASVSSAEPPPSAHSSASANILAPMLRVFAGSRYVADQCAHSPELLRELITSGDLVRAYADDTLWNKYHNLISNSAQMANLQQILRLIRHREMVRIAWRDLADWADIDEILSDISSLADLLIQCSLTPLQSWLSAVHGEPIDPKTGQPMELTVLGMGKLGAKELNFSSDIDLIFAYPEAGFTKGARSISHQEFFTKLGRQLIQALDEGTGQGRAFRVDVRLRPFGGDGPLVNNFDAMEHYYERHGREWERYALIKARVITGDSGHELLKRLQPFIYRRYLDFGVIDSIRNMKRLIEQENTKKGLDQNVKLGLGGIREIEFFVQAHQLIQGGKNPELMSPPLKQAVRALVDLGFLGRETADRLIGSYNFLRRTENRLQMCHDQQTHLLPTTELEKLRLAFSMGYADWPEFNLQLSKERSFVQHLFAGLLEEPADEKSAPSNPLINLWSETLDESAATRLLENLGFEEPAVALSVLVSLGRGHHYRRASEAAHRRLSKLIPLLVTACAKGSNPDQLLPRLCNFLEVIINRSAYLVLLQQNQPTVELLVSLFGLSTWVSNWITLHPMLLDELLHPDTLYNPPREPEIKKQLARRLEKQGAGDLEQAMNDLREVHHGNLLRIASAALVNSLSVDQCSELLSGLAKQLLIKSVEVGVKQMEAKFGRPRPGENSQVRPSLLLIAYGRLGSRELGFNSDLDLVFLYDNCSHCATTDGPTPIGNDTWFMRLAQRCIHVLTTTTTAGKLYEVDLRLRPGGNAGPAASTLNAFEQYLRTDAWTWEHQALVKARPILGDPPLCRRFEEIRTSILCLPRDKIPLQEEVVSMRKRIDANTNPSRQKFHLKQSRGGLIDIEFLSQYLVLFYGHNYPQITQLRATREIIGLAKTLKLIEQKQGEDLLSAHQIFSTLAQRATLRAQEPITTEKEAGVAASRVRKIWREILDHDN